MRIRTTVCFKNWPRHYTAFHQELKAPFRRCEKAHIFRIWSFGFVFVPRWDSRAEDAYIAAENAINARYMPHTFADRVKGDL